MKVSPAALAITFATSPILSVFEKLSMMVPDLDHEIPTFPFRHQFSLANIASSSLIFALALLAPISTTQAEYVAHHIFSINDVIGDFDGTTYAEDKTVLCGTGEGNSPECNANDLAVILDDGYGTAMYPIDSTFGFEVADFLGAKAKDPRDGFHTEGYAGNITDGTDVIGIRVSNVDTDTYKAPARFGPWCSGMGGFSIKCSTEHYTVMEHILSCHETVPYLNADPVSGVQKVIEIERDTLFGTVTESTNCANEALDNTAFVVEEGTLSAIELNYSSPFDTPMDANDNTNLLKDIAVTDDFSVTLKDDGKLLYRWGNMVKRPNDIRLRAKMSLPDDWKEEGADFEVTSALLKVYHKVTNNPNDQLRAEDLENEGATGRKPSYWVDEDGRWRSIKKCYEGDADWLEEGTVLKNPNFSHSEGVGPIGGTPFTTEDLVEGYTNAWYTTLDRDPFEWSYEVVNDNDANVHEFVGSLTPISDPDGLRLVSGPRWRLRANKFGQDIPGLEIPKDECSEPPFERDNIKYEVGAITTTVINLLDWDGESPLARSRAWVDYNQNSALADVEEDGDGKAVSVNGLELTNDFDLAVYIKGDKKPTDIYSAELVIEYFDDTTEEPPESEFEYNLRIEIVSVEPKKLYFGHEVEVMVNITNAGPDTSPDGVDYKLSYEDSSAVKDTWPEETKSVGALGPDQSIEVLWKPTIPPLEVGATLTVARAYVVAQLLQEPGDLNSMDDQDTISFNVKRSNLR